MQRVLKAQVDDMSRVQAAKICLLLHSDLQLQKSKKCTEKNWCPSANVHSGFKQIFYRYKNRTMSSGHDQSFATKYLKHNVTIDNIIQPEIIQALSLVILCPSNSQKFRYQKSLFVKFSLPVSFYPSGEESWLPLLNPDIFCRAPDNKNVRTERLEEL